MQKEWDEETKKAIAGYVPIGRMGQPKDIPYCALFLASDESSFIPGLEIVIDGGIMVKVG
jgi:NAD(P)-dependent dehydrogenase (short-subunit alcohol dehydrogenase family)